MDVFRESVCCLTDIEASSVRTEMYYCTNIDVNKTAVITNKGDIIKSTILKAPEKSHTTKELVGYRYKFSLWRYHPAVYFSTRC